MTCVIVLLTYLVKNIFGTCGGNKFDESFVPNFFAISLYLNWDASLGLINRARVGQFV